MQTIIAAIGDNLVLFLAATVVAVFLISRLRKWDEAIYAALAFASFAAFLFYIVVTVPSLDLTIVAVAVAIMIAVDFFMGVRESLKENEGQEPGA
jgi:hypothetical protein